MLLCYYDRGSPQHGLVLHAKGESNGVDYAMILRGVDLKFNDDDDVDIYVTLQFRKTKTDQEAFGTGKTMYESKVPNLCVVSSLRAFRKLAPQRFGTGSEACETLFRWAMGKCCAGLRSNNCCSWQASGVGLPPALHVPLVEDRRGVGAVPGDGRDRAGPVQRYLHDGETALKQAAAKMAAVEQIEDTLHLRSDDRVLKYFGARGTVPYARNPT